MDQAGIPTVIMRMPSVMSHCTVGKNQQPLSLEDEREGRSAVADAKGVGVHTHRDSQTRM